MARMIAFKMLYGAAFTVVLPALLILWAGAAEPSIALPVFGTPALGLALALCGVSLTIAGMRALWRFGGGLPMNAFPPPRFVSRGVYRWIAHPIYTGFIAACLGVSMAARSAAGLWLVTPSVALGCAALVLGYERPDMQRRFGSLPSRRALRCPASIWEPLRRTAELLANSWREWRIGPVRIINHGAYAALAAFVQVAVVMSAAAPEHKWHALATAFAGLIGAGVWAQWVEGSSRLRRPFGFYGGLIGAGLACLFFEERWILLAAHCLAAPWMQAIGRLRCLVNGCCHGAPAPKGIGIHVFHPRSRVTRLAGLAGVSIHATQLYSILTNGALGILLAAVWSSGAQLPLVCGVYAIGNGCARFVEEAYRGEPQTKIAAGLRLYQWIAAGSVAVGAVLTTLRASPAPTLTLWPGAIIWSAAFALLAAAAMGVDFPESDRPFARLT